MKNSNNIEFSIKNQCKIFSQNSENCDAPIVSFTCFKIKITASFDFVYRVLRT